MHIDTSASSVVYRHSKAFGQATIIAAIPSKVDGLKQIHRRLLVAIRDQPENTNISSTDLIGDTMKLHPHGDDSIYQAAVRLGQDFEYWPALLEFDSASGTYHNPQPAADRYTKLKLSDFARDIFFKGIEYKALPKQIGELRDIYEPTYLAPAIPTALLYANSTIGYAYSSYTLPHNLADVCDLVVAFAQHMKLHPTASFDTTKHAEKFIPDFPILGTLTNYHELLAAYRRGEFEHKVRLDGEVKLTSDTISIRTLPYGVPFKPLFARKGKVGLIEELLLEKGSWFDRNIFTVKNLSKLRDRGDVCIRVKRGVNVFDAWEQLRKRISFSGAITPIPNYNTGGYAEEVSPPNLLRLWYDVRYNILISSKKMRVMTLTNRIRETEAHLIVCGHTDEVVRIIRGNDVPTGIQLLQNRFDLTPYQANYLVGARLSTLSTTAKAELEERLSGLQKELAEVRDSFAKIPDEIAAAALAIKKKYPTPRRTKLPNYLGYVKIDGGCIQIESIDEIGQIITDFPKVQLEIYRYDGPHLYKVSDNNKLEVGSIPKITTGDIYGLKSKDVITVNITDGTACAVRGFIPGTRAEGYFYTTTQSRVIHRNGDIRTVDITKEISLRKTICRGATTSVIYVYPDIKHEHYVIALNTSTPNEIVIQRVAATDRTKISMNPVGDVHLVHSVDKHAFINIPPEYLNRNTTRVVEFVDLDKLLDGKNQLRIDIATSKTKSNKMINLL